MLFVLLILSITSETFSIDKLNIASGIVPHHLLAKEIIDDFFKYIFSREKPETIILLSPDHWHIAALNQENSFITVALEPVRKSSTI